MMRNTLRIIKVCQTSSIPFIFEHPTGSFAFKTPEWKQVLANPKCDSAQVHLCAFGARWRKATKLVLYNLDRSRLEWIQSRLCHGRHLCDFSLKPHVILKGKDPAGISWTRRAQEYPTRFCNLIASLLAEPAQAHRIQRLWMRTH